MAGEKQEHRNKKTKQTETDQRGRDRKQQQRSARQRRAARVLLPVRVQTQECFSLHTSLTHEFVWQHFITQPVTEAVIILKTNSFRNDNISVPVHIEACQMSRPDSSHDLFPEENKYTGFDCQWLIQRG